MATLIHVSGWADLSNVGVGDIFTLLPGPQHAEGVGVYFSEGSPRPSAAEGARNGASAVVSIDADDEDRRWWRTKSGICRKLGRARTWHSAGRPVKCQVIKQLIQEGEDIPTLLCTWVFGD